MEKGCSDDYEWFSALDDADKRLEQARVETERKIASVVTRVILVAEGDSSIAREFASGDTWSGRAALMKCVSALLTLREAYTQMQKKAELCNGGM